MAVTWSVEDGTGKADASTYMDLPEFKAILENLGYPLPAISDDALKILIVSATQYLDRRWRFYGSTKTTTQNLQWPRTKNFDEQGRVIAAGTIPTQLKKSVAMFTYQVTQDSSLLDPYTASSQGSLSSWSQNGTSVSYKKDDQVLTALFDARVPDVEVMLRSVGELKQLDWLGPNLQTVVR
jgi:hypothetical protein